MKLSQFFKKVHKIAKTLTRNTKKKKKALINKIRNTMDYKRTL